MRPTKSADGSVAEQVSRKRRLHDSSSVLDFERPPHGRS